MIDYYEILEVSPNASPEVIKGAYKILLHRYNLEHDTEDRGGVQKLHYLNLAYDVLSDPDKRRDYDEDLSKIRNIHHEYAPQPYLSGTAAENVSKNSQGDTGLTMDKPKNKVENSNQSSILSRLKWNRWGWSVSILAVVIVLISMVRPDPEKALRGQLAVNSKAEKDRAGLEIEMKKAAAENPQANPAENQEKAEATRP